MKKKRTTAAPRRPGRAPRSARGEQKPVGDQLLARDTLQKFRIIFNSVKSHFREVEARCGVTGAQLWAIAAIAESDGLRVTELARAMSIHQSTASNLVGVLEERGLVRKERGKDQRVVRLHLSEKGAGVAARAPKPMIGVLPEALEKLPKDALLALSASLDLLIQTMQLKNRAAARTPLSDTFEKWDGGSTRRGK